MEGDDFVAAQAIGLRHALKIRAIVNYLDFLNWTFWQLDCCGGVKLLDQFRQVFWSARRELKQQRGERRNKINQARRRVALHCGGQSAAAREGFIPGRIREL